MDDTARMRLKQTLEHSDWTADALSRHLGWPATYVSRVTTGRILTPSPDRLSAICASLNVSKNFILKGEQSGTPLNDSPPPQPQKTEDMLQAVAEFVRQHGLVPRGSPKD